MIGVLRGMFFIFKKMTVISKTTLKDTRENGYEDVIKLLKVWDKRIVY